jgi:formylglycine-generating enzyme required for sulfatase activity
LYKKSKTRVVRGACWDASQNVALAGRRSRGRLDYRSEDDGFRLVQEPPGERRVLRGGSWLYYLDSAHADSRYWYYLEYQDFSRGFRLIQEVTR